MTLLDPSVAPHLAADPTRTEFRPSPSWLPFGAALIVLGAVLFAFTEALRVGGADGVLGESGPVEIAQVGLLIASTLLLLLGARCREASPLLVPMAAVIAAAAIRELDGPLDAVFHGAWKYPAWTVALAGLGYAIRRRRGLPASIGLLSTSRAGGILAGAGFVVLIQSRVLGRQEVWRAALGDAYVRDIPRLIEELSELAGYGLLFIGCIELHRVARLNMCRAAR